MTSPDCTDGCTSEPIGELAPPGRVASEPEKRPHPFYPDRWADGTVRPGYPGPALTHGGRSSLVRAGQAPGQIDALGVKQERTMSIVADLGGADELSTVALDVAGRCAELSLVADHLFQHLMVNGPLTAKGRSRAALRVYLATLDRLDRMARLVGLARRPKPTQSLEDLMQGD